MPEPRGQAAPSRARTQQLSLWILAGLAFAGLVMKIAIDIHVAGLEREVVEKQQFVNETMMVSRLNVQLAQLLANVAASTGDRHIGDLLREQGIEYDVAQRQ